MALSSLGSGKDSTTLVLLRLVRILCSLVVKLELNPARHRRHRILAPYLHQRQGSASTRLFEACFQIANHPLFWHSSYRQTDRGDCLAPFHLLLAQACAGGLYVLLRLGRCHPVTLSQRYATQGSRNCGLHTKKDRQYLSGQANASDRNPLVRKPQLIRRPWCSSSRPRRAQLIDHPSILHMQLTSIRSWVLGLKSSHAGLKASSHDRAVTRDGFHTKRERRRPHRRSATWRARYGWTLEVANSSLSSLWAQNDTLGRGWLKFNARRAGSIP